jgi:hypothetical protein
MLVVYLNVPAISHFSVMQISSEESIQFVFGIVKAEVIEKMTSNFTMSMIVALTSMIVALIALYILQSPVVSYIHQDVGCNGIGDCR